MLELFKKHGLFFMIGIAIVFMLYIISTKIVSHKNIATVNVNAIMKNYVQKQARLNIDPENLSSSTKAFVHQLEQEIKVLSDQKGTILFVSEAVLAGTKDYTSELEKKVYQSLNKTGFTS